MEIRMVDIHNHPSWHSYTPERLVENMDRLGIGYAWLLSVESTRARDRVHARRFLVEFPDRLLFGRDGTDARLKNFLLGLDLPPSVLEKNFCANAERLVSLDCH